MKILFIYPVPQNVGEPYQEGIASISAVLKQAGHETKLIHCNNFDKSKLSEAIERFNPKLVFLSTTTDQFELSNEIINYIYENFNLPVIMGGAHPTASPSECISIKGLLGICRGEGEYAALELVESLEKGRDYTKIKNFWFKKDGKIIKNKLRGLIRPLDELPFPDKKIFYEYHPRQTVLHIMVGRGCPFSCSYCIHHSLRKLYKNNGKYVRLKSVNYLISEIQHERENNRHIKHVHFMDDLFNLNRRWTKAFLERYSQKIKLPFSCLSHVQFLDEEMVRLMKSAGCTMICMGVEAGNDFIRNDTLNKKISKKEIISAFRLAKKFGILTISFNMIGVPFETEKTIKETIMLNRIIKPEGVWCSIFRPYPGTALFELCKSKGYISNRRVTSYKDPTSIIDQPSISKEKIRYYFIKYFNRGYKKNISLNSIKHFLRRVIYNRDISTFTKYI